MIGPTAQYATNHRHGRTGGRGSRTGHGKTKRNKEETGAKPDGPGFFCCRSGSGRAPRTGTYARERRPICPFVCTSTTQEQRTQWNCSNNDNVAATMNVKQQHHQQPRQSRRFNNNFNSNDNHNNTTHVDSKRRQRQRERDGQRSRERQSKNIVEQRRTSNID